jgi:hypothetical protein
MKSEQGNQTHTSATFLLLPSRRHHQQRVHQVERYPSAPSLLPRSSLPKHIAAAQKVCLLIVDSSVPRSAWPKCGEISVRPSTYRKLLFYQCIGLIAFRKGLQRFTPLWSVLPGLWGPQSHSRPLPGIHLPGQLRIGELGLRGAAQTAIVRLVLKDWLQYQRPSALVLLQCSECIKAWENQIEYLQLG